MTFVAEFKEILKNCIAPTGVWISLNFFPPPFLNPPLNPENLSLNRETFRKFTQYFLESAEMVYNIGLQHKHYNITCLSLYYYIIYILYPNFIVLAT